MRSGLVGLLALLFVVAFFAVGLCKQVLVVQVDGPNVLIPVSEGEVFFRSYTHSMYQVPVTEKFLIENGHFRLVHVRTQSDAVLAYLGLEGKNEPNADAKVKEFSIPAASIGNHVLRFPHRDLDLGTQEGRDGRIRVKLTRVSLFMYLACLFRR
jgi:hypothetical protein